MTHNKLVSETTQQLPSRFLPDPMNIKKRMEALIWVSSALLNFTCLRNAYMVFPEGVYLERCEDRESYNYLASSRRLCYPLTN
jgi:hypothetical protein